MTFDDGPNPDTTPHLLELLAEEKVPATFFLIGQQISRHTQLGKDIVNAGHAVGNHSFQHEFMPGMPLKRILEEINRTNDLLREISKNRAPNFFRPPYGILDKRTADCVKSCRSGNSLLDDCAGRLGARWSLSHSRARHSKDERRLDYSFTRGQ